MSWLRHIGETSSIRAWVTYDWANSAIFTIVLSTLFPIFYKNYICHDLEPATSTFYFSVATTLSAVVIAIKSPILGALADRVPIKKYLIFFFLIVGVAATGALTGLGPGDHILALVLFSVASIGLMGTIVFYDSLLPTICHPNQFDRVSTKAFAAGYVSGTLLLGMVFALMLNLPFGGIDNKVELTKFAFAFVALWWLVFSVPLFLKVKEPTLNERQTIGNAVKHSFKDVIGLTQDLKKYPNAFKFLMAYLVYNDGVGTVIKMAAIYGAELNFSTETLLGAILVVQLVAIPCTLGFANLSKRFGTKNSIYLALGVYVIVCVFGYFISTDLEFYALAVMIGLVQGGVQSLSRSLFASMIPKDSAGKFFGLYAVFEKFAGIFGPLLFAVTVAVTGNTRNSILGLVVFFVVGAFLLARVDVHQGQKDAKESI